MISKNPAKFHQLQKGFIAIVAIILIMTTSLIIGAGINNLVLNIQKWTSGIIKSAEAYYIAEAGLEDAIYRIIKNKKYQPANFFAVDNGQNQTNISEDNSRKIIESIGTSGQKTKKLKAVISNTTTNVSFYYGAQAGDWGIDMQPGTKINGNIYSNGSIRGSGDKSQITGDAWAANKGIPNQQWVIQNSDLTFIKMFGVGGIDDAAQSFKPNQAGQLLKISLYLKKSGEMPNQTVKIVKDKNGQPSKNIIAQGTIISSQVGSNYSWVNISLESPPTLNANETYWILIDTSNWFYGIYQLMWGKDITDGYPHGTGKYTFNGDTSNPTWFNAEGDLNFKIWMENDMNFINNAQIGIDAHANIIKNSSINHDAYYQTLINTVVKGTQHPNSPDPTPKDLPISYAQIQKWETAAETGGIINNNYMPSDNSSLGPVKINGDLNFIRDTIITITGPIWVTGNITGENNVTIKLKDGLSSGFPIIADNPTDQINFGKIKLNNNIITQDSATGGLLLFISANKSLDITQPAIWLYNNVNKDQAQSIIFSLQGVIKMENNAKFKEISGYGLYLTNNAEIVYEEGLINANFSSGPSGGWEIQEWKEIL